MTVYPSAPQDNIKYTLTGPDGSVATFNDPTDPNYIGMAKFTGLDGAEHRESLDDRSGADGALQGNNYLGRRPIVCTVEVVPNSTVDRNQRWTKFKRASFALRADAILAWTTDGGLPQQARVRRNQPPRRPDDAAWVQKWTVALVAADPWIYSQSLHTQSGITALTTITNQGDGQSAPSIDIVTSATGSITITNQTTGESINLPSVSAVTQVAYSLQTGGAGSTSGLFNAPEGVAIDSSGNIFVADGGNNRVQKFNSAGVYQSQFGSLGSGNGQFSAPRSVAIDSGGNIFVVDGGNNRVQKFNAAGVYQSQFGSFGSGNGQFNAPEGIAIDQATNNIFVVDQSNNRVQKFNSAGAYQSQFGSFGSGNGQFNGPASIALDSTAAPFVTDYLNNRVQKFTNAATPVYASQFGSLGAGSGQFNRPYGIAIDSAGNIFVTERNNHRVQKFNAAGVYQSQFGSVGSGNGQFNGPYGIAITPGAVTPLWVVDSGNNRIQKFTNTTSASLSLDLSSTSVLSSGVNAYSLVDVPSTVWWKLQPGDNSIRVTGSATFTSAAINWRDAWQ